MKRAVMGLFAVVLVIANFAGCTGKARYPESNTSSMFVCIEDAAVIDVYYHKDTKVMYVRNITPRGGVSWEWLVNPDGTPMTWGGE